MASVVKTKWIGDMKFDSLVTGHHLVIDADEGSGGHDAGPRPKALLLTALTGCAGMDIVSILKKMKVENYTFEMQAEGEPTTEHPVIFHTITVRFKFFGDNLPPDKILKAVNLSNEKYCGATAMLREAAKIIVKIYINDEEVAQ
ncbi:MAG: OsmC family protein [Candidatus Cloacimonadaceae bacterium]|jgi:putative redox protein|nr:OsmC family protein [Candidatus Cloacimonadota bacterium]MDY0126612.1 OsmC family protein [Candidatus Cloacimonadaceae bacterium]